MLWVRKPIGFAVHQCILDRNIIMRFEKIGTSSRQGLPESAVPTDITIHNSWLQIILPRHAPASLTAPTTVPPLASWNRLILSNTTEEEIQNVGDILNSLTKLYLVSDGSLVEYRGGYASVLATDEAFLSTTYGATPLVGDRNTSFRTEAYGMLSGLTMLISIIHDRGVKIQTMRVITVL